MKPSAIPAGAPGARILLARIKTQIANNVKLGEDAARDDDPETAWVAATCLKKLRPMEAELEAKLAAPLALVPKP